MKWLVSAAAVGAIVGGGGAGAATATPGVALVSVTAKLEGTDVVFEAKYRGTTDAEGQLDEHVELANEAVVIGGRVETAGEVQLMALVDTVKVSQALDGYAKHATGSGPPKWMIAVTHGDPAVAELIARAPHGGAFTATLALTAPSCFYRDARYVAVPRVWRAKLPRRLAVTDRKELAAVETACARAAFEGYAWMRVATTELAHSSASARIQIQGARLDVAHGHYVQLEVALATQLADVPNDLATAIVVDTSRSLDDAQRAGARRVVASYLAHVPGTRVQAITFARTPSAVLPRWTTAEAATTAITRAIATTVPQNGSDVGAALREAAKWLKSTTGTRRILLVTDQRLDNATLARVAALADDLGRDTLVNVVALGAGELVRDDDARLAPLASVTGGIVAMGDGDAALVVTPQSLDHAAIDTGAASVLDDASCGGDEQRLLRGTSCRATVWASADVAAPTLRVSGDLWSAHVSTVVSPTVGAVAARQVARHLVGSHLADSQPDATEIAIASDAVSAARSLFVTWGRATPADTGGGGTGWGVLCGGCQVGTFGHGSGTGEGIAIDTITVPALQQLIASCAHAPTATTIEVELTRSEIVGVRVAAPPPPTAVQTCIERALWHSTLELPSAQEHTVVTLTHARA